MIGEPGELGYSRLGQFLIITVQNPRLYFHIYTVTHTRVYVYRFGLCINDSLTIGHSEPSDTYGNDAPLGGEGRNDFAVFAMEVWGLPCEI